MQYVLGNMLNGGGGLNADGLALDLQFAADKTLTARKGPTPVFTRASSGTFVGSNGLIQTAATNIPRFDHTSAGVCRGLLIEESRTNLLLQSENFGTTWTAINLNTTGTPAYLNVATAPDGATTADKLIANTTNSIHQFRQNVTLVSGTNYTISVYYKAAETNFASISVFGVANGNVDWDSYFNISASSPAAGSFNGFSSTSLVDVGNGWRRCSATFTATASGTISIRLGGASSTTNVYTGDGTSGILLWGAQLETGSFATSYIPTTTSSVVRSADVCSITSSTLWNASEGTLLSKTTIPAGGFDCYPANWVNFFGHRRASSNTLSAIVRGGGTFDINLGTFVSGSLRVASTHGGNLVSAVVNGGSVVSATGLLVLNSTVLGIGQSGAGNYVNGPVDSIRYYRKRLANSKLIALTT